MAREPKYLIQAYDGHFKYEQTLPSHSEGHRLQRRVDKKDEALQIARAWMAREKPQSGGRRAFVEISTRTGNEALWEGRDGQWIPHFNRLEKKAPAKAAEPPARSKRKGQSYKDAKAYAEKQGWREITVYDHAMVQQRAWVTPRGLVMHLSAWDKDGYLAYPKGYGTHGPGPKSGTHYVKGETATKNPNGSPKWHESVASAYEGLGGSTPPAKKKTLDYWIGRTRGGLYKDISEDDARAIIAADKSNEYSAVYRVPRAAGMFKDAVRRIQLAPHNFAKWTLTPKPGDVILTKHTATSGAVSWSRSLVSRIVNGRIYYMWDSFNGERVADETLARSYGSTWKETAPGTTMPPEKPRRPHEVTEIRFVKKLAEKVGPLKVTEEGEENIYFTDRLGHPHFFKHGGSEATRSAFYKAIGAETVGVGGYGKERSGYLQGAPGWKSGKPLKYSAERFAQGMGGSLSDWGLEPGDSVEVDPNNRITAYSSRWSGGRSVGHLTEVEREGLVKTPKKLEPTLNEVLAERGLTVRPTTKSATQAQLGRKDVLKGGRVVLEAATAAEVWAWLKRDAPVSSFTVGPKAPAPKGSKMKIKPLYTYAMGASSSPRTVVVTSVTDDAIRYVQLGDPDKVERVVSRGIGEDLIAKGMETSGHTSEKMKRAGAGFEYDKKKARGLLLLRRPRLNKQNTWQEYVEQLPGGSRFDGPQKVDAKVTGKKKLSAAEYDAFVESFLTDRPWLKDKGGAVEVKSGGHPYQGKRYAVAVIEVSAPGRNKIYVNPEGYAYARYVLFPADATSSWKPVKAGGRSQPKKSTATQGRPSSGKRFCIEQQKRGEWARKGGTFTSLERATEKAGKLRTAWRIRECMPGGEVGAIVKRGAQSAAPAKPKPKKRASIHDCAVKMGKRGAAARKKKKAAKKKAAPKKTLTEAEQRRRLSAALREATK